MTRDIEREVLPAAQTLGIGLLVWSPLNRGMLGGILARERDGRLPANFNGTSSSGPTRGSARLLDEYRDRLERYENLCAGMDLTPARVALAWLLSRPGVTSSIIGAANTEELDDTLHCLEVQLDDKALAELDSIFPGYRTAPEDYAW